jgi:hypothetical protein
VLRTWGNGQFLRWHRSVRGILAAQSVTLSPFTSASPQMSLKSMLYPFFEHCGHPSEAFSRFYPTFCHLFWHCLNSCFWNWDLPWPPPHNFINVLISSSQFSFHATIHTDHSFFCLFQLFSMFPNLSFSTTSILLLSLLVIVRFDKLHFGIRVCILYEPTCYDCSQSKQNIHQRHVTSSL